MAALCAVTFALPAAPAAFADDEDGIVRVKSAYALGETIARLKQDIAGKGIKFFTEIDQAKLAAEAGVKLHPSTLLVFGNPPLGTQFTLARPLPHVLTYYSFVTLTTVGYGDVSPVSAAARTLAWVEALTGQFYLAVIVAGLVSVMAAGGKRGNAP